MSWVVARTHPLQEERARTHAGQQGHATYLPTYWDKKHKRPRILFPSYLFIEAFDRIYHLWSTRGIRGLICMDGKPATVQQSVIDELRTRENPNGHIQLEPKPEFTPGQALRVRYGPLQGQLGIYQGMSARDRVRVLLTLFGSTREVPLERRAVEAA